MFSLSSSSSSLYVWAWTEEQKNKIMTANTSQELTQEEYFHLPQNKMYDVFDSLQTSEEIDEFDTCGFSAREDGFKVLQCWEDKGHPVK